METNKPIKITVWLTLLCIFIIGLFIYTRCRMECVKIGYEINRQEAEKERLEAKKNELIVELKTLQSPEQIEKQIIRHKLDLKMPTPGQTIEMP